VIYGLTIQKIGKKLELRCLECTSITGRISLLREQGTTVKVFCPVHPENYGQWPSQEEMEQEKLALAKRIGLM
jgi:hypothetical protein